MSDIKSHHEINTAVRIIADWRSMAIAHAIYENGPIRYRSLASLLGFSPTVLSQKLTQLTSLHIITRHKIEGSKEVTYTAEPIARDMVRAYHILESVDNKLKGDIHHENH